MASNGKRVRFLRPGKVAELWGCDRGTVHVWALEKGVEYRVMPKNGERRYREDQVDEVTLSLEQDRQSPQDG